jgi:hypothetical protein
MLDTPPSDIGDATGWLAGPGAPKDAQAWSLVEEPQLDPFVGPLAQAAGWPAVPGRGSRTSTGPDIAFSFVNVERPGWLREG